MSASTRSGQRNGNNQVSLSDQRILAPLIPVQSTSTEPPHQYLWPPSVSSYIENANRFFGSQVLDVTIELDEQPIWQVSWTVGELIQAIADHPNSFLDPWNNCPRINLKNPRRGSTFFRVKLQRPAVCFNSSYNFNTDARFIVEKVDLQCTNGTPSAIIDVTDPRREDGKVWLTTYLSLEDFLRSPVPSSTMYLTP